MTPSFKQVRRSSAEIIRLLQEKHLHHFSTATFCKSHGISHQTYYNWEKRYGSHPSPVNDFIPLTTLPQQNEPLMPFCEVMIAGKSTVRFFSPVDAKYLKALIS